MAFVSSKTVSLVWWWWCWCASEFLVDSSVVVAQHYLSYSWLSLCMLLVAAAFCVFLSLTLYVAYVHMYILYAIYIYTYITSMRHCIIWRKIDKANRKMVYANVAPDYIRSGAWALWSWRIARWHGTASHRREKERETTTTNTGCRVPFARNQPASPPTDSRGSARARRK